MTYDPLSEEPIAPGAGAAKSTLWGGAAVHRRDLKAGVLAAGLRGATLVSKFLLTLALARLFTPAELGVYGIMAAGLSLSIVLLGLEFYSFGMRELMTATAERTARMLRDQLVLYLCGYVVLLPVLCGVFLLGFLPSSLLGWFLILVVLEHVSHETTRALLALSRPLAANLVLFVRAAAWVYVLLAVILLVEEARDLRSVFLAWAAGAAISPVVAAYVLRQLPWRRALARPVDWPWLARGLWVARPFVVSTASATGLVFLDRFFIQAYHGAAAVGVYTFFAGISMAAHMLVNSAVAMVRLPRIVVAHERGEASTYEREMRRLLGWTAATTVLVAGVAALAIFPVLDFVDQPIYSEEVPTYFVLLVAASLRCLADVPVYGLYARKRDLSLLAVNLTAFTVAVAGNAVLVPVHGEIGAAIAAVMGAATLGLAAGLGPRVRARGVRES